MRRNDQDRSGTIPDVNVLGLDPVDLDDTAAHANAPAQADRDGFIDKAEPPAHPVIVAQDQPARTRFDGAVVEPGGVGTG